MINLSSCMMWPKTFFYKRQTILLEPTALVFEGSLRFVVGYQPNNIQVKEHESNNLPVIYMYME